MFIAAVETALEKLIRQELPLPEDVGDVTFEAPTNNWSAQLSRVTVNLFLYNVSRSPHPARALMRRDVNGGIQKRAPQPMVQLSYLLSAWAGSIRDEHLLLGDVVSRLIAVEGIPAALLPQELSTSVSFEFVDDSGNKN
ncbi:MAG: DUF4255 domain-containing protein, partial [Actinomycetia bacterium]|nr:DUF4255 domain-containing protein [Actinomycetes bacterium]